MITGQGLLIIFAGYLESHTGLESIQLNVMANPQQTNVEMINPQCLTIEPVEGELHIISYPQDTLTIPTVSISKVRADSLLKFVREWNIKNGFAKPDKRFVVKKETEKSWWTKHVSEPLSNWIKENFAERKAITGQKDLAGNIGLIYFYLSNKPEAEENCGQLWPHSRRQKYFPGRGQRLRPAVDLQCQQLEPSGYCRHSTGSKIKTSLYGHI